MISSTRRAHDRLPPDPAELRRLRLAIEASGEIVFMTDAKGTFTYVNPEFERVYGYDSSEVIGRTTPRLLKGGTTGPEEYALFWHRLKQSQIVRREFLNRTKHGTLLIIEASANPIVDDSGEIVGFLAVQRDVTERRQVDAALEESEHRYRTLADAAHDSIFIVNRAAQIEYVNNVSAARFGRTPDAIIGKRLEEVFPPSTAAEMWREVSTVFATADRRLFEQRFESPTGELCLETCLVPVRVSGQGSGVHTVMGVARDVTERKALERQLMQAQKMEAVGRLAGGIAHDFNNLLTAILGYSELLQDRVHAPDVLADLDEIKKAGEQASRLTRQLLAFSRKQPMIREVVDVSALVGEAQRILGRVLGEDIELSVIVAPGVRQVIADPGQIEQILMNLAVNARDAMPKGGRLTIATANAQLDDTFVRRHEGAVAGSYVSLTVQDAGCGMTADVLAHVFEPFFTTKPVGQGTGLGLSTVYGIVKQNGGYITIASEAGSGTTVTVFWPMSDHLEAPALPIGTPERAPGGTETILLVEDEAGIRSLMRKTLEPHGYRILEARDVSDAMAISETHDGPIDLLLSDVIMPVLNGPDLAQRIVTRRPTIKVFYVSGFPNSLLSEQERQPRRVWFLAKPFTPQSLALKVRECLDSHSVPLAK
jgi:two-component system, cell cycle sensor histidine kinase and response regulator CckA